MNQAIVRDLNDIDEDWTSEIDVIQGTHEEITAIKMTLTVRGRRRTGLARVLYQRPVLEPGLIEVDPVDEATKKAFVQAARQFGITLSD